MSMLKLGEEMMDCGSFCRKLLGGQMVPLLCFKAELQMAGQFILSQLVKKEPAETYSSSSMKRQILTAA